jgi:putative DNA primase/helicase
MGDWTSADGRLGPAAKYYAQTLNWQVFPVHGIDDHGKCTCGRVHKDSKEIAKHPASAQGQKDATTDVDRLDKWWAEDPNYNVALFAKESGYFVIDIDPRSGGDASFEKLKEMAKDGLPPTVEAITGVYWSQETGEHVRGRHMIYKCGPDEKFIGNFNAQGLGGLDIKHNGYVLISPSRHHSGVTYDWKEGHAPWNMEIAEAPEELLTIIRSRSARKGPNGTSYSTANWDFLSDLALGDNRIDIEKILEEGITEGNRAVGLYSLACALANKHGTSMEGRLVVESLMLRFNAEMVTPPMEIEGPNSVLMHTRRALDWVADNPKINLFWGGISDWVKEQGMDIGANLSTQFLTTTTAANTFAHENDEGTYLAPLEGSDGVSPDTANSIGDQMATYASEGRSLKDVALGGNLNLPKDVDALSGKAGGRPGYRSLSDVGNGRRLVDAFGSTIRYTPNVGWFLWDGNYWKPDTQKLAIREVSKMVSTVCASEVVNYPTDDTRAGEIVKWANQAKSNARIQSLVEQANSDERIQVELEQWDNSPTLMGVANGVVDLKTGELKVGRPDLHITRRSPISYVPGMTNVRWTKFLEEATSGDKELQDWLQRAVGYTLTGLNSQDIMFLIYGPPGSGKNTFVETIYEALGKSQYAWALDSNVLAASDRMNSTDEYHMAELRGRRMIWVDELPENGRIKENQVKKLTGSGTLQGRSPGEKPIQFTSHGKLWISTNHRPIITDDAMWRRMRPIPLTNKPEVPDPTLKEYLADPEGALPAVLAWAVEGAVKYLNSSAKDPLGWCSVIKEAHDIYKKNEDRIGAFLEEETIEVVGATTDLSTLFHVYKNWSAARDERNLTQIGFQRKLSDRGIDIIGVGTRATIRGYQSIPREVQSAPVVDFSMHAKYSKGAF